MANSPKLGTLKTRFAELRTRFLPATLPAPTGVYSDVEVDLARAYRLLVHAEIEAFIEDRVLETILDAIRSYKTSNSLSRPILGALAYARSGPSTLEAIPARGAKTDLEQRLDSATSNVASRVKANNGLRSKDLAALLFCVGVQESDLDTLWVANMDNFGQSRGDVAHRSTQGRLAAPQVNPADEFNLVEQTLLPGIEKLDLLLNEFVGK